MEGEEPEDPYLETGSKLHKAFEATISKEGLDRAMVHEFLYATQRLDSENPNDLSFNGVKESTISRILDDILAFKKEFAKWASVIKGE